MQGPYDIIRLILQTNEEKKITCVLTDLCEYIVINDMKLVYFRDSTSLHYEYVETWGLQETGGASLQT